MKHFFFCWFVSMGAAQAQVQKFAPGIISNDKVFATTLSSDQRTLYFVNSRGGRDTLTISESVFNNGAWGKPQPVAFSPKPGVWKDIDPFITPDGSIMIFNSNRPTPERPDKKDFDIWMVRRDKNTWAEPINLGKEINSDASDFFATTARNGNLYFSSTRTGNPDIYRAEWKNGAYQKPVSISALNTPGDESNPYIAPSEDFMIFLTQREDGYGDSDIYISFNNKGTWSTPLNLGSEINTPHAEFAPYFNVKTNTLYFSRIIRGTPMVENIFFTTISLKALRKAAVK